MDEHSSYHQSIPGEEARRRLKKSGLNHCYLTRYSDADKHYKLTIYMKQRPLEVVKNFRILLEGGGRCRIEGKEEIFDSIEQLLEHYEHNRLDPAFKTIGKNYTEDAYRHNKWCTIL